MIWHDNLNKISRFKLPNRPHLTIGLTGLSAETPEDLGRQNLFFHEEKSVSHIQNANFNGKTPCQVNYSILPVMVCENNFAWEAYSQPRGAKFVKTDLLANPGRNPLNQDFMLFSASLPWGFAMFVSVYTHVCISKGNESFAYTSRNIEEAELIKYALMDSTYPDKSTHFYFSNLMNWMNFKQWG